MPAAGHQDYSLHIDRCVGVRVCKQKKSHPKPVRILSLLSEAAGKISETLSQRMEG